MKLWRIEFFIDLEIVGGKLSIFGGEKDILTIIVQYKNEEKCSYRIRKWGFYEILKILREKIRVGIKVKEMMSGPTSFYEINVDGMPVERRINHSTDVNEKVRDGMKYLDFLVKKMQGIKANHR